ncbi:hypothetical protein [Flavobacterium reichenbachii]|uniref:Uncharacterized protein n=1 Tax=Flavobacterium reichenbachii TaxID=362418 RepID=A0A085ZFQ7_9FLAO|nr:hypothetical protein [Flavobacterium reichenbachii]KFF03271.1 hypothetical protein IW19_20450 [Flavobacterium reichenbachii]OXB15252.1 hypothetical protein B0A68_11055 [Flavobacterium reichenbachii]
MAKKINPKKVPSSGNVKDITGDLFETNSKNVPLEITNLIPEAAGNLHQNLKVGKNITNGRGKKESVMRFSLQMPIYIEMHRGNLLQFIASALVYPYGFSNQQAFADTQSLSSNALVLSNGIVSSLSDEIILVQVDQNVIDEQHLKIAGGIGFYKSSIPVSRILKIFVSKTEIKKKLLDDASIRDGGFLPEKLLAVGFPKDIQSQVYTTNSIDIDEKDFEYKLDRFDKILGLIAGARNYSFLTSNQTNVLKSISDHTLFAIQSLESDFARDIITNDRISEYYKWLFTNSCPDDRILLKWIFSRIQQNDNFTDSDTKNFELLCFNSKSFEGEEGQIKIIFSLLFDSVERKKSLNEILKLQSKHSSTLYVFAYLRIYASKQNPELARLELVQRGSSKYSEYAFATLNFYFGYKLLRNSEDRLAVIQNKALGNLKNFPRPTIKLELTAKFDYLIIDIVFKSVFNPLYRKENNYSLYPNLQKSAAHLKFNIENYTFSEDSVYDKPYFVFRRTNPLDELLLQLERLPSEISIFSEFGLYCYRLGLKLNTTSFTDIFNNTSSLRSLFSYQKNNLIEKVKEDHIDIEELKSRIALAQKHKEI